MTGAPKSPPAPEPEFAAPLEDEADEASPAFELDLDEAEAEPGPLARGAAVIKAFWRHAPLGPGVYRMIGADGEVLYVGKARSIKKRVQSYTTPERQTIRIARMIAQTVSMVFVTTETEAEALLLEANFIKQLKPRYNVLLRDDKSFPYILIAGGHDAPRLIKHRGARSIPGDYFGPFANAGAVARTLNALQRAFLLRTCSDSYYDNRTRPCLLYQIKRCSAPCTGEIALDDYAELVARGARLPLRAQPRDPPASRQGDERGGAKRSNSKRRRGCATASPRCRRSRASRASTRARCPRPTCSRSAKKPGSSASRRSSSAPIRTGATAPTFRAPTAR